jgi:capsule polysaccharide modification protein KpsS
VVFKVHPGAQHIAHEVRRRVATARYLTLAEENIHSLVAGAAGVVVLTSGVGFESLIHGKPVVSLGRCDYGWATFQAAPEHLDAALAYVRGYSRAQREEADKFVYYYYRQHAYLTTGAARRTSAARLLAYLDKTIGGVHPLQTARSSEAAE